MRYYFQIFTWRFWIETLTTRLVTYITEIDNKNISIFTLYSANHYTQILSLNLFTTAKMTTRGNGAGVTMSLSISIDSRNQVQYVISANSNFSNIIMYFHILSKFLVNALHKDTKVRTKSTQRCTAIKYEYFK